MTTDIQQKMLEYYSERAGEYDEIYTLGMGQTAISDPNAYTSEAQILSRIVGERCSGNLIDIACGTAFWLPAYAAKCTKVTLFDQSLPMLRQAERRATAAGILDRTAIVHGDILSHRFDGDLFDCAVIGFLLSHLTVEQEAAFFGILRQLLTPEGLFVILDSAWSNQRAATRRKEGTQERILNDGRGFLIYKRYFAPGDLTATAEANGLTLTVEHFGKVFFAVSCRFRKGQPSDQTKDERI